MTRVPLMLIKGRAFSKPFKGFTKIIDRVVPGLGYDLQESDIEYNKTEYVASSVVNSLLFFILFFALLAFLKFTQGAGLLRAIAEGLGYGIVIFLLIFAVLLKYPKIIAGKKAELVDKHLLFALKDLQLQVTSGITLYNGMVNISKAGYGQASKEFERAAKAINTGTPMTDALERMALESKSEFLKKTTWQFINTIKAGASLKSALSTLIRDLTLDQRDKIKRFAAELNLWVLVYMLFAVAIPTIGATLLVILSSFAGFDVTRGAFISFVVVCFIVQGILIGFVKTRRPVVII